MTLDITKEIKDINKMKSCSKNVTNYIAEMIKYKI